MVFELIPNQLLYILVGAAFSAVSALSLSTYQEYKQSERTRRVLFSEMKSMKELLEEMAKEDERNRPVRTQIEHQFRTKMYDQHLPNLGRLTGDEIGPVSEFYKQITYIRDAYLKYNQIKETERRDDKEATERQRGRKLFYSGNIQRGANRALKRLEDAENAREEISFWQYILS